MPEQHDSEHDPNSARDPGTEQDLIRIWMEVFETREVDATSDFFQLGGTSLLATVLLGRISADLGVDLSAEALFTTPSIRELAAAIVHIKGQIPRDLPA